MITLLCGQAILFGQITSTVTGGYGTVQDVEDSSRTPQGDYSILLTANAWAKNFSGPFEETTDGLKIHTNGYRNGNRVFSKEFFNLKDKNIYIKWLKYNGGSYMRGWVGVTNTMARVGDISELPDNQWLYSRIIINSTDKSVMAITCTDNYDDASTPGNIIQTLPGEISDADWYNVENGNIYFYFNDTQNTNAYLTIGEVVISNSSPQILESSIKYDFADGIIPNEFITNGNWTVQESSLFIEGNIDDSLMFSASNATAVKIIYKISHDGDDSSPLPETATSLIFSRNNISAFWLSVYYNGRTSYASEWCEVIVPADANGNVDYSLKFTIKDGQKLWIDEIEIFGSGGSGEEILTENFDSETFPTNGWTQTILNTTHTWQKGNPAENNFTEIDPTSVYSAICGWVTADQDEWLNSPVVALPDDEIFLTFYAGYGTDYLTYATMKLNISVDGGTNWTKIWEANNDGSDWQWREISIDLSDYKNNTNVMLGWQYVGNDGDLVAIDNVSLTQGGTSGIGDLSIDEANFKVSNYPNPFSLQTTISLELEKSSDIELVIFNSFGQKIKEVFNGSLNMGDHKFQINAQGLKPGFYYYRLMANGVSATKPMLLVR